MIGLAALALSVCAASAEPTEITIRVLSKDAKFVGSTMGGVQIVLRDADTREILASGVAEGSTGDTQKIMTQPRVRGQAISTEGSAKYTAVLDLDRPRLVTVEAYGPLAQRQSAVLVSSTQWVVPGKPITGGDGWMLELPGLVVDVREPPVHLQLAGAPQKIRLLATVTTMCGCPVEPGGLWNADKLDVAAILSRDGKVERTVPLSFAGQTSQFQTELNLDQAGVYEATVYAYDRANGITGLDRVTFVVR
jgi:hypothetical protein